MKTASTTSATGSFSVTPLGDSYYTASTSQYMDITIDTWQTTGDKNKEWTATSTAGSGLTQATSTIYTIDDLTTSSYYQFKLDGSASTTAITGATCANGTCLTDSSGNLTFTYVGGYSTHTFGLEKDVTAPSAFTLTSPTNGISGIQTAMSWTASSDSASGIAKYQLYIDGVLDTDNISSSATSVISQNGLSCGNHTWYVRAVDNAGNTTDSNTFNYAITCGGSSGRVRLLTSSSSSVSSPDNQQNNLFLTALSKLNQTSNAPFHFSRKLFYGSRGNEVSELQKRLTSEGVYTGSITGYFGHLTREAVRKYQTKNNLAQAGVIGPLTLQLLNSSTSSSSSSSQTAFSSQDLTLTQLVELLINLGVISPDKAEVARMAIAVINKN